MQDIDDAWLAINAYITSFANDHDATLKHLCKLLEDFAEAGSTPQQTFNDFSTLIDLLQHQPFVPNYATDVPLHIAHLSSLLADQPEPAQTAFLHLVFKVAFCPGKSLSLCHDL